MEISWKLKKLYYYIENIFTKRVYLIGRNKFGLVGYCNKLIGKCFGWSKTIICLEELNNIKNFYKPLPLFRKLSFNKYYYPWFSFNKLIRTIIIYKEKGYEEVIIGYVSSFYDMRGPIVVDGKVKVMNRITINFPHRNLLSEVICDSETIPTKDIIILGYFKMNK